MTTGHLPTEPEQQLEPHERTRAATSRPAIRTRPDSARPRDADVATADAAGTPLALPS